MPALLAHMQLVKDLVHENPKLFSNSDIKYLVQGANFPDIHYITNLRSLVNKPNFSKFLHENDTDYGYAKLLMKRAQNKQERLFAIGFLSHIVLDKNVHELLKKKGIYYDITHMVSEYYLEAKFPTQKIPTPRFPLKLIKDSFKTYYSKEYNTYKNRIKISIRSRVFYDFVNSFIIKKIINGRYRTENKRKWSLLSLPFKLSRLSKFKKMGYDYSALLHPDTSIKNKYLDDIHKEYQKSKIELINLIMEEELKVVDYASHQKEIRDFI